MKKDGSNSDETIEKSGLVNRPVRVIHPRLQKILEEIKTPSPAFLPRDDLQPISGKIVYALRNPPSSQLLEKPISKPSINLSLGANAIMTRRNLLTKGIH